MTAVPLTADRPHAPVGHTTPWPMTPARRLPFGCVTGHAKAVEVSLAKAALSGRARQFLQLMHARSFGDAGYHTHDPGLWCEFSLAEWASELGMQRQNLWRLREHLVALHIITYQSSTDDATRGIMCWNLNVHEWIALNEDYRRARYTRPCAGKKPTTITSESNRLHVVASTHPTTPESNGLRSIGPAESNRLQDKVDPAIKMITDASSEVAVPQAAAASLRKVTKKGRKKDANASRTARARGRSQPYEHMQETTGAYWSRQMTDAGDDVGRQRTVVYQALRDLLHVPMVEQTEFAKTSIVFQHAKRSWAQVLTWVLRASIVLQGQREPLAYLLGMRLSRQQRASSRERRPFMLPVTPASTVEETSTSGDDLEAQRPGDAAGFQLPERAFADQVRWEFMRRGEQGIWDRCSCLAATRTISALAVRFAETGVSLQEGAAFVHQMCCEVSRHDTAGMTNQHTWAAIAARVESALMAN